ncbi:MAG: serine protease [bacterium]|nr:serine protease [bacterium]
MAQKNKSQRSYYVFIAVMFVGFFASLLAYLFFQYMDALQFAQANRDRLIESRINESEKVLNEALLTLDLLVQDNVNVSQRLEEEREKSLEETAASASQIEQLQKELENSKVPNLSEIISYWNPRVAKVKCTFEIDGGEKSAEGSAVLFPRTKDNAIGVASSRHLFEEKNGDALESCTIKFPTDSKEYSAEESHIEFNADNSIDSALVKINGPSPTLISLLSQGSPVCSIAPQIGDSIVILGYPSVGSKESITATEGIISGIEANYYVTSAKVERGNSGGAAILAKQNCYLGIPTFTTRGVVESFARILKQELVF